MTPSPDKAARELLAFYLEAGVDAPMGEEAVDRFAGDNLAENARLMVRDAGRSPAPHHEEGRKPPPEERSEGSRLEGRGAASTASAPPSPDAAAVSAREAAKSAKTLEELRAILDAFEGCALKATATQLAFADGNPKAKAMFVGEAPGRDEDIEGLPFVGRSGKLLDRMLAAIGLDRASVYIANIVPWRPPGNRTPTPQESQICLPFIQRQIELVDPDILVCLGGPSAQTLLGIKDGITKTRGRWFSYHTGTREIRAMPTFHPAFLLRSPLQKRLAWRDFLAIKKALAG
ncbi:MAG: uracil-DNA glycosylase [Xanthobacteraceae bacterium]